VKQVGQPATGSPKPRSVGATCSWWDAGDSRAPVPTATAVAVMSWMVVVWMAPAAVVHDGFQ
jgi:hypothetical protein